MRRKRRWRSCRHCWRGGAIPAPTPVRAGKPTPAATDAEDEPELTKSFDLWLGALARKWGVQLPSIRDYEGASAVLLEKIDRWEAEILEAGRQQGQQEGELKGRQEGRLEDRQEGELRGRLETIDGLLRAGIEWPVIQSATGIDELTYRTLKRDSANGTEQAAPRQ